MHYPLYILCLLLIQTTHTHSSSYIDHYKKKIKSFFDFSTEKKIEQKEFPASCITSLSIENRYGPITIKTGWKKKSLCLKTIQHSKPKNNAKETNIVIDTSTPHHMSMYTKEYGHPKQLFVEYELIIPTHMNIILTTEHGDISIENIEGNIKARTHTGSISINNTKGSISAQSLTKGSLYIKKAAGKINAITEYGDIIIQQTNNSITARTKKGKIDVVCEKLPPSESLSLETSSGNILVTLPKEISATINCSTLHGTITSEHYITLKPYTTQLNTIAWNKIKKEIQGTIGSGDASISLSTMYGTIKILETDKT